MYCSQCGKEAVEGSKFCASCGQGLNAPETEPRETAIVTAQAPQSAPKFKAATKSDTPASETNLEAITALVLGLVSVFTFDWGVIPLVTIVISALALRKAAKLSRDGFPAPGKGMAIAGLVLGVMYSIAWLLYLSGFYPNI
jgi:hypothetical protein